jgi:hypothetical protein
MPVWQDGRVPGEPSDRWQRFDGVSLRELDRRAALLRRVDNKYAVRREPFAELMERLLKDHEVLDIDGRREFVYASTYFETRDLRCFVDHVEGRLPRFKARTRLYVDSDTCVFEVKLKRSDDETDKRQLDYSPRDRGRVTPAARGCLDEALSDAGLELPDELEPSLETGFHRVTLAGRGGSERLTCDFGVRLSRPGGASVELRADTVLVETKSENGESPADRTLAEMGIESISLSKYRVGMSLVGGARTDEPQPGSELFG